MLRITFNIPLDAHIFLVIGSYKAYVVRCILFIIPMEGSHSLLLSITFCWMVYESFQYNVICCSLLCMSFLYSCSFLNIWFVLVCLLFPRLVLGILFLVPYHTNVNLYIWFKSVPNHDDLLVVTRDHWVSLHFGELSIFDCTIVALVWIFDL